MEDMYEVEVCIYNDCPVFSVTFTAFGATGNVYGDYRLLGAAETETICGGLNPPSRDGGGGIKGGSSATPAPKPTNITLSNVPYVSQLNTTGYSNGRSDKYCGIASALMVRAKEKKGSDAPYISESNADLDKERIDRNLQDSTYGERIDVANYGLLYVSSWEDYATQFNKSVAVLQKLYTAKNDDGVSLDQGHVSGINVNVYSAFNNQAADVIFNHIKNTSQPAVIIIDSNIQYGVLNDQFSPSAARGAPLLHYNVVVGISETSGQEKRFFLYDPYLGNRRIPYSATQMTYLMSLPTINVNNHKPEWVYGYPWSSKQINDPCYVGLVQGD